MQAHVIADGVVVNTIEVESLDFMPGLVDAALGGSIGWLWDGAVFTQPATPARAAPQEVTMRQARLALLAAGLLGQVDAAINALDSPAKEAAQIEWEFASTVERQSGFVAQMGAALGLDDSALDQLFTTAAEL